MSVDEKGFKEAMEIQRKTAREAREVTNYMGADVTVYESIDPGITTEFVGYDNLSYESEVTVLATDTELVDALSDGERGTIFVGRPRSMPPAAAREADKGNHPHRGRRIHRGGCGKSAWAANSGHIGHVSKGMIKVGTK